MTITVDAAVISSEASLPFEDVSENQWFYEEVVFCYGNNIVKGMNEYTFSPDSALTRAQFVVMLAGAVGAEIEGYTNSSFDDVAEGSWYLSAAEWAYENKIVAGVGMGANIFAPDRDITREQICTILMRYMVAVGYDVTVNEEALTPFADRDLISEWALEGVKYTVSANIISGLSSRIISPLTVVTRAQAARIMHMFCQEYYYGTDCTHENYSEATCTEASICECGMKIGLPDGHRCSVLTCVAGGDCTRCGAYVESDPNLHSFIAANCTKPRTCRFCGTTRGYANGHSYSAATCTAPKTCAICNVTTGSALGHGIANGVCPRCGEETFSSSLEKIKYYIIKKGTYQGNNIYTYEYNESFGYSTYSTVLYYDSSTGEFKIEYLAVFLSSYVTLYTEIYIPYISTSYEYAVYFSDIDVGYCGGGYVNPSTVVEGVTPPISWYDGPSAYREDFNTRARAGLTGCLLVLNRGLSRLCQESVTTFGFPAQS